MKWISSLKQQRGVALIQVLLITFMLLILIVQLSREAQLQVRLATQLKSKHKSELQIHNSLEKLKYALLTEDLGTVSSIALQAQWNFFGEPFKAANEVEVRLQDEAGLMSLPFAGDELKQWLGDESLYNELRAFQGMQLNQLQGIPGYRNGYLQSDEEVRFVPGWRDQIETSVITRVPTEYFNLFNSPETLYESLFDSQEVLAGLHQLRQSGNLNESDWREITGKPFDYLVFREPGSKILVNITARHNDVSISRTERLLLAPLNAEPLVRIMR